MFKGLAKAVVDSLSLKDRPSSDTLENAGSSFKILFRISWGDGHYEVFPDYRAHILSVFGGLDNLIALISTFLVSALVTRSFHFFDDVWSRYFI